MRFLHRIFACSLLLSAPLFAQQTPSVAHAQFSTHASQNLNSEIESAGKQSAPVWLGYSIPVTEKFSNGWYQSQTAYLEGGNHENDGDSQRQPPFDHANLLLRVAGGEVEKVRIEAPDRTLDLGGLSLVWLTGISQQESLRTLATLTGPLHERKVRDTAVLAISLHPDNEATAILTRLAGPDNDLFLREKAAFWLANQRGHEGFLTIQRLARNDTDENFRAKLTFDFTLTKEPTAIDELIRMAHEDSSSRVRKQAQFWMAQKAGKRVAPELRRIVENDPDQKIRKSAVFALSQLPGDEAAAQLIQVAQTSKDPEVRKQAVFWLGQSKDPRALDYLTKILRQ